MKNCTEPNCIGRAGQIPLLSNLKDELLRGVEMISAVDDHYFRLTANGTGSIGGQFRHNLDFVNNLLKGADAGRIDYSDRERDAQVEVDRQYSIERFRSAIRRLNDLSPSQLSKSIVIRSEIDPSTWLPSSFVREAEFVHSHTVHHHALISEKLAGFGVMSIENFGVAQSTLEYWNSPEFQLP